MSILHISSVSGNYGVYKGCFDEIDVSVNWVSTIFSIPHSAIKGLHFHIIPKSMYWSVLYRKGQITCPVPYPEIERQSYINAASTMFAIESWYIQRATWWHLLIMKLLAAFLGKHSYGNMTTMSQKSASMVHQPLLAMHHGQCDACGVTAIHNWLLGRHTSRKVFRYHSYYIVKMSINGGSTRFRLTSWNITALCGNIQPWTNNRPPF
jgi:hypothetical protein